ncbi:hypothetical protein Z946_1414 [Sulfitobacter noctilucicola]|uniref:Uncharacterized protein n=1 Tax=Sulfitobacter noctilucicola TaxID=1342301 RepID=A0A7W6M5U4_9RHOB|nr:hypothetical protein [Sulfitobacter noctilucicola]KIN62554.1 hypothetical protein Z946_1414 [Sulfitobacter noctilucicola]MBB4172916.1 hypothetical protein [Sulfitobacter noctilucicola]
MYIRCISALALCAAFAVPAFADAPEIQEATAKKSGAYWTFDVTLLHGDTGWDHYADSWRVVDNDGNVLGTRNLAHPHTNEQPFTRSLSGVEIPSGITEVGIQASDNLTGWSSQIKKITLK